MRTHEITTPEALRLKILSNIWQESNSGCWIWLGGVRDTRELNPRPTIYLGTKQKHIAYRVAYSVFVGPIGDSQFVCHKCDNSLCLNPFHLFIGSPKDNMRDMISKGRSMWQTWPKNKITRMFQLNNKRRIYKHKLGECSRGVYQNRDKFSARITINKKVKYLGIFLSKEEAHKAYLKAQSENEL